MALLILGSLALSDPVAITPMLSGVKTCRTLVNPPTPPAVNIKLTTLFHLLLPLKRFVVNVLVLNGRKLLTRLFMFMNPIGILSLPPTVSIMLFSVALLSPASITFATLVELPKLPVRPIVPRLAAVLSISKILPEVPGNLWLTMWSTPPSLLTRPPPPRSSFVALTTTILVPCVPLVRTALKIMEVGLEFLVDPTRLILV